MADHYISAEWATDPAGKPVIRAIGNDGDIYWVPSIDCDVPPWPAFLETEAGERFAAEPVP